MAACGAVLLQASKQRFALGLLLVHAFSQRSGLCVFHPSAARFAVMVSKVAMTETGFCPST